jgi:hypothetical protein
MAMAIPFSCGFIKIPLIFNEKRSDIFQAWYGVQAIFLNGICSVKFTNANGIKAFNIPSFNH